MDFNLPGSRCFSTVHSGSLSRIFARTSEAVPFERRLPWSASSVGHSVSLNSRHYPRSMLGLQRPWIPPSSQARMSIPLVQPLRSLTIPVMRRRATVPLIPVVICMATQLVGNVRALNRKLEGVRTVSQYPAVSQDVPSDSPPWLCPSARKAQPWPVAQTTELLGASDSLSYRRLVVPLWRVSHILFEDHGIHVTKSAKSYYPRIFDPEDPECDPETRQPSPRRSDAAHTSDKRISLPDNNHVSPTLKKSADSPRQRVAFLDIYRQDASSERFAAANSV